MIIYGHGEGTESLEWVSRIGFMSLLDLRILVTWSLLLKSILLVQGIQ